MQANSADYTNTFRNLSNSTLISGELYASKNFKTGIPDGRIDSKKKSKTGNHPSL
jgi:hypothetical protein